MDQTEARELAERLLALMLSSDRDRVVDAVTDAMREAGDMSPLRRVINLAKSALQGSV